MQTPAPDVVVIDISVPGQEEITEFYGGNANRFGLEKAKREYGKHEGYAIYQRVTE